MEKQEFTGRDIYVDLDSLYDTRLAILEIIDEKYALMVYSSSYMTRQEDSFPYIDKLKFKEIFDKRDNRVLERALTTNIFVLVKDQIKEMCKEMTSSPDPKPINLVINIWPYDIDKDGAELIAKPFHDLFKGYCNIHILNKNPQELNPKFFGNRFCMIIMYDYNNWLKQILSNEEITRIKLSKSNIILPKLYLERTPDEKELEDNGIVDPFKCFELAVAPILGLEYMEVAMFSAMIDPIFLEQRKKELGIVN